MASYREIAAHLAYGVLFVLLSDSQFSFIAPPYLERDFPSYCANS